MIRGQVIHPCALNTVRIVCALIGQKHFDAERKELFCRGQPVEVHLGEPVTQLFEVTVEQVKQERILAVIVVVDVGLGNACILRKRCHACAVKPLAGKDPCRRFQDGFALGTMILGLCSCHALSPCRDCRSRARLYLASVPRSRDRLQ